MANNKFTVQACEPILHDGVHQAPESRFEVDEETAKRLSVKKLVWIVGEASGESKPDPENKPKSRKDSSKKG